jgi:hypothetical protein
MKKNGWGNPPEGVADIPKHAVKSLKGVSDDDRGMIIRDIANMELIRIVRSLWDTFKEADGTFEDLMIAAATIMDVMPYTTIKLMHQVNHLHDGMFTALELIARNMLENIPTMREEFGKKKDPATEADAKKAAIQLRKGMDRILKKLEARNN